MFHLYKFLLKEKSQRSVMFKEVHRSVTKRAQFYKRCLVTNNMVQPESEMLF